MSDTQGANLEGDMPGVGTAPPTTGIARSPLQLPSALQGLAKFFQGSQGPQAKPKPPFPPKPPVLTEEQANQRPQHTGKPASFDPVPATIPSHTDGFTPYMKTANKRDFSEWGDPVRFPRLPATFEVMPMLHQIGQYFAQAGGDVGAAGADTAYHSAAYWDAFMKAQDYKRKAAKDDLALSSAQLEESLYRRSFVYKDKINEYLAAAGGDRSKLGSVIIGGMNLYDALHAEALQQNDTNAIQMFEEGQPLEHIINYWQEHDKVYRDLQAARQKAGDQEGEDAAYGLKPQGDDAYSKALGPQSAPQDQTQPRSDADYPEALPKGLDPKMVALSEDRFRGVPRDPAEGKDVGKAADAHEKELEVAANKILADAKAGRIKPSEVMPAIRKALGPRIAADAEHVGDYSQPGYGSGAGSGGYGRQADYPRLLDDIAAAADPADPDHGHSGFVATHYKEQEDFRNNNQIRTALIRTRDLPAMADEIKQDIATLRASKKYNMNDFNWQGIYDRFTAGDPDFQKLWTDMQAYSTAYQTIVGGGKATLGGTRDVESAFPPQSPLGTYFRVIKGHMAGVRGIISGYHADWESKGGKPTNMPRGDPAIERKIDDYWQMDPNTGAFPYDPKRPDNDFVKKPAGKWGPAGDYYWTNADPTNRDDPRNWKRVE